MDEKDEILRFQKFLTKGAFFNKVYEKKIPTARYKLSYSQLAVRSNCICNSLLAAFFNGYFLTTALELEVIIV